MAAVAASSGAFANDYDWTVGANPETDVNHNVINCNGLTYENSVLTFNVNKGDLVRVGVVSENNNFNINVTLNSARLNVTLVNGQFEFVATFDGTVGITLGDKTSVSTIYVESDNYRTALGKIESIGKAAVNKATVDIANYSVMKDELNQNLPFDEFFSAIKEEINIEARKVAQMEAELEKAKAENTVGELLDEINGGKLVSRLTEVKDAVEKIVENATKAKENYENITRVKAKGLDDRLVEAAQITVSSFDNNALTYIWDFEQVWVNNLFDHNEKTTLKAPWAETELAAIASDRDELKKSAWEELGRFPKQTKNVTNWDKDFGALKDQVDNMIARAIVERDYKDNITGLKTKLEGFKKVLDTKNSDQKTVFTEPAGYEDWTVVVGGLNDFINKEDNRRDFTQADLAVYPVSKSKDAETTYKALKAEFANQAYDALMVIAGETQECIDTYSYKISAKYQNEPATQEQYQKEFAEIQAELNGYKEIIKGKDYVAIVEGYRSLEDKMDAIVTTVKNKWTDVIGTEFGQKGEIIKLNKEAKDKIIDQINSVRAYYNDYITRIETWKKADYSNEEMVASLNAYQRTLFDIVCELDDQQIDVTKYVQSLEDEISKLGEDGEAEFDPNDAKKYRFDGTNKKGVTYESLVAAIETRIKVQIEGGEVIKDGNVTEVDGALEVANLRAWKYFLDEESGGKETMTLKDASKQFDELQRSLDDGLSNSKMSQEAYYSFGHRYLGILDKNLNNGVGENYDVDARLVAKKMYDEKTLADNLRQVSDDYVKKIKGAVEDVNEDLNAYYELYQSIAEKKVDWTVAKSQQQKYQDEYNEYYPDGKKNFVEEKLNDINALLQNFYGKLEENALSANELKGDKEGQSEDVFAKFDKGFFEATNIKGYVANENAKANADAKVAEVMAEIENAKGEIAGYSEEIQTEAMAAFTEAETIVSAQKSSAKTDYEAGKLGDTYAATIEAALNQASDMVKKALEEAKRANEAGSIDYNHDGKVDGSDFSVAVDNYMDSHDAAGFANFIDAYMKYKKNH